MTATLIVGYDTYEGQAQVKVVLLKALAFPNATGNAMNHLNKQNKTKPK